MYLSWSSVNSSQQILNEVVKIMKLSGSDFQRKEIERNRLVTTSIFDDSLSRGDELITINELEFSYADSPMKVLRGVSLKIFKGESIGIIGETGSGKSTLIDLIMGLNFSFKGSILINDISLGEDNCDDWHSMLAHVPQTIYLLDSTVAENIAMGESGDSLDMTRIEEAAKKAKLHEFVSTLADGYQTKVGERG